MRGHHLGTAAALEGRKHPDAAISHSSRSAASPQRDRYFSRLFVLEFDDELPFGADGTGDHARILYEPFYIIQDIVFIFFAANVCAVADATQVSSDGVVITL